MTLRKSRRRAIRLNKIPLKKIYFGNDNVMLTERGTTFGYQDLVVDFRGVPQMKRNGVPVVVDITHSVQRPNQSAGVSGGDPELIETIGRAAVAVGCDGIFMETHPNPAAAKSDGANMLPLDKAEGLLETLLRIHRAATAAGRHSDGSDHID